MRVWRRGGIWLGWMIAQVREEGGWAAVTRMEIFPVVAVVPWKWGESDEKDDLFILKW